MLEGLGIASRHKQTRSPRDEGSGSLGGFAAGAFQQVFVNVASDRDRGVAEPLRYKDKRHAGLDHEGGRGVPEIMQSCPWKSGVLGQLAEAFRQLAGVKWRSVLAGKN